MCLVNGKERDTVLKEIEADEAPLGMLDGKYPYHTIDQYEKRLNNVVGRSNWQAEYQTEPTTQLSTGQVLFEKKCVLKIFDQEGCVALYSEGFGGEEVKWSNKDQRYIFLSNAPGYAKIAAFKDALRSLNMFGIHLSEDRKEQQKPASSKKEKKPEISMVFLTEGPMAAATIEERTNKPVYKLAAHEVVGNLCRENTCDIIFYPNQYGKDAQKINNLCAATETGQKKISIKVSESGVRNNVQQYVFKGFA